LIPQFDHHKKQVVSVLGISTDITKQKTLEIELHKMVVTLQSQQKTLQDLSKALIRSQEEERARISRELHDEIGQQLTAISLNLKAIQSQPIDKINFTSRLSDARALVKMTMDNIHRFSIDLRPTILDELGLIPACKNYIDDFRKRTGIKTSLKFCDKIKNLDFEIKALIFRSLQESLNNVIKHFQANEVEISLLIEDGFLVLHVSDNGIGFDMGDRSKVSRVPGIKALTAAEPSSDRGIGLIGMRERAHLVGGSCTLFSNPNSGTTITVKAPHAIA
jgi:signal transduction histidine kinase